MPSFTSKRSVKHSPRQMFDLVADVEQYPDFVPLCESLKVTRIYQNDKGLETRIADMGVGYKAIQEHFTSRIVLDSQHLRIMVDYIDGPFRILDNRWTFHHQEEGCLIEFYIHYEFKNLALSMLMGRMFDKAFRKFTEAFEKRADIIYKLS